MFCHKCGNQLAEGSAFCPKCGAKLTANDAAQQTAASPPVRQMQPPTHNVSSDTPKKKKSKKLPIILAALGFVFVVILIAANSSDLQERGEQARKDEEYIASQRQSSDISLSETYTNEAEGFSFKYPSDWTVMEGTELYDNTLDDTAVVSIYAPEGFGSASNVLVNKTQADNTIFDYTKADFEREFSAMFDEVSVTNLSKVNIDGVPAIELGLSINTDKEPLVVVRYYYIVRSYTYIISGTVRQSAINTDGLVIDAIMESYTITAANTSGENSSEIPSEDSQSEQWTIAYADKVRELAAQDNALQFALIDLTGSNVPELVADYSGYRVSVFTWTGETLIAVMEDWPYGAMGNLGYEYLTSGNVIRNYNNDHAGAIVYESYMKVNDAYEVVELNEEPLSIRYCKDINGNGQIDENEYVEAPLYYYGEKEITEKEYASYQIPGDYERIAGDKSAEAILSQLGAEIGTGNQEEGEILYKGHPVAQLLGSTPEELNKIFGAPTGGTPITGDYLFGEVPYYEYGEITFLFDYEGMVESITVDADAAEVNGTALSQNRTGIINLLGIPGYEGQQFHGEPVDYYLMEYTSYEEKTSISVEFPDANSKANYVAIVRYFGDPSDEYQEPSNNIDSSSLLTADGNTLSVGSLVYAKQNVFGVSVNYVRGYVTSIDDAGSVSVQWDTLLENRLWAFDECAILSDSSSPSGYSYYSSASGKQIPLAGVKFNLSANELYSKIP